MVQVKMILMCMVVFAMFSSCSGEQKSVQDIQVRKDVNLAEMKPRKPVKIELKRKDNGAYSWEITGDNVEKIIEADQKLKRYVRSNEKEER